MIIIYQSGAVVGPLLNTHEYLLKKISQLLPLVATLFVSLIIVHLGVAKLPLTANLEGRQVYKQLFPQLNFRLQRLIFDYHLRESFKQYIAQ